MNIPYDIFSYNSVVHFIMFLAKFHLFTGKNAIVLIYAIGHLLLSVAQTFIKKSIRNNENKEEHLRDKYVSSGFGICGHICLFTYMYIKIYNGNNDILSILFFLGQIGMISFYTNNFYSLELTKLKKAIFSLIFGILFLFYIVEAFESKDYSKYIKFLVSLVYIDLMIFINFIGSE